MNDERLFSLKNPWFAGAVGGVAVVALVAGLVGFVWVPYQQGATTLAGIWDAICSAAGVPASGGASARGDGTVFRSSEVAVTPQMLADDSVAVGRGATLALRCSMCHGIRGTRQADIPNLAGQGAAGTYKQLRDFQSGHRISQVMAPHVRDLTDRQMRDLALYYASLPRVTAPPALAEQLRAPAIIQIGAPMRNIAPCVSCHGGSDLKTTAPILDGEAASYIRDQLRAFATDARRNDILGQMRNIARQMTPEEIETVARYYSRQ